MFYGPLYCKFRKVALKILYNFKANYFNIPFRYSQVIKYLRHKRSMTCLCLVNCLAAKRKFSLSGLNIPETTPQVKVLHLRRIASSWA